MPIKVLMPALSPTMEEGKLSKWLVKEGDKVSSGDIIAEVETDKATIEYESTEEGVVGKLLVEEGKEGIKVNDLIAVFLEEGETEDSLKEVVASGKKEEPVESKPEETKETKENDPIEQEVVSSTPNNQVADISYENAPLRKITVREAIKEAMAEEMRANPNIFLMGEEVGYYKGAYKVSQGLLEEFGTDRVLDTPISEYGFTGLASGAAFNGLIPIVEYMTFNFSMQAIDHIINTSAKTLYMSGGDVPSSIVFRGLNGGGSRVAAQHSQCFASWYAHIPGLKVVAPYSAEDAKGLLKSSLRDGNPIICLEHEVLYGKSFDMPDVEDLLVPIGKAKIEKSGSDVSLISFSMGVDVAMKAADMLEKESISAEVVNLRTLRPLDIETIVQSVQKTNRVVVIEEGWPYAGIASEIIAVIMEHAFDYLDAPVLRATGKDVPMPYAANLEKLALLTPEQVVEMVKKIK